ncbi:MAG: CapA family protein [Alphaproteobacteria bacterium]|nr:CapA family protein [Alphaproteobacteria bacterium]
MQSNLPATPADVLDLSSGVLRFVMNFVIKSAECLRFWSYPYKKAATSFEEMTLWDTLYWAYKCTNPITHWEKGGREGEPFTTDRRILGLPPGFEKQSSLTMGAAGDLLRADGLDHSKDILFENVADLLFAPTISYANFESPITKQALQKEVIGDKGPPVECCSQEQFTTFKGHKDKSFTVMNTANNHMFDMGTEGVETTRKVLSAAGILSIGTNDHPDESGQGKILIKDGIKLGFVAATFGLNGRVLPPEEAYRINVANLLSKFADPDLMGLKQQIDHCKSQGCDFIIASLHWGHEFEFFPRQRQIAIAHDLIELGADTLICHHPHVVQPVEYYKTRRDPRRIAVIAYSLGTMTWGFSAPHLVLSAILNLTLSKGRLQDEALTYVETARVTPVFRSSVVKGGDIQTRIEKLADHLEGQKAEHSAHYIAEIKRYADLVLGDCA